MDSLFDVYLTCTPLFVAPCWIVHCLFVVFVPHSHFYVFDYISDCFRMRFCCCCCSLFLSSVNRDKYPGVCGHLRVTGETCFGIESECSLDVYPSTNHAIPSMNHAINNFEYKLNGIGKNGKNTFALSAYSHGCHCYTQQTNRITLVTRHFSQSRVIGLSLITICNHIAKNREAAKKKAEIIRQSRQQ